MNMVKLEISKKLKQMTLNEILTIKNILINNY